MSEANDANLRRVLSRWDILSIGIGAVIGWSWVIYAGVWAQYGGSWGSILAFCLGGALCSFIGLVYSELTSALPRAGGDMVFAFEGLGQTAAFVTGMCIMISFVGLVVVETITFPLIVEALGLPIAKSGALYSVAGQPVFLSFILVSLVINMLFAYLNYKGVSFSGIFQTITVAVLLVAAVFFFGSGLAMGSAQNLQPYFNGAKGLIVVMLMVPSFMAGFNAIPQAAEETDIPPRTLGRMVITTVWACVLFYILIILGLSFAAPAAVRGAGGGGRSFRG